MSCRRRGDVAGERDRNRCRCGNHNGEVQGTRSFPCKKELEALETCLAGIEVWPPRPSRPSRPSHYCCCCCCCCRQMSRSNNETTWGREE